MNLIYYLGNFHPLLVHLPIGILTIFLVLGVFISREQLQKAYGIIRLILMVCALSATFSSISGYLLSSSGSYTGNLVTFHQILGISLTIINWIVYLKLNYLLTSKLIVYRGSLAFIFVMLILTGHAGGSLTHGADFLIPPPPQDWFSSAPGAKKTITLKSTGYAAASNILKEKCVVCHGKNKQKGELRLDTREGILEGGESGQILADHTGAGLLVERIVLPLEDEDHMPPAERKQLTELEINFLAWWIMSGADMEQTLEELHLPDSLSGMLVIEKEPIDPFIPALEVKNADEAVIKRLWSYSVIITPVGLNSNYLSASFINVLPENTTNAINELAGIKDQLIKLNLDYQQLENESWKQIGSLTNLRKLSVKDSNLDDATLHFQSLALLVSLNLVGTKVSIDGLKTLGNLQNLEKLYLYRTSIQEHDLATLQQLLPKATIDTGNYIVPILKSDTSVLRLKR